MEAEDALDYCVLYRTNGSAPSTEFLFDRSQQRKRMTFTLEQQLRHEAENPSEKPKSTPRKATTVEPKPGTSHDHTVEQRNVNTRTYMGQGHIIRDKKKPPLKNTGATVEKRPKRSGKEKPEVVTYKRPGRDDDFIIPRVNEPTRDVYEKLRKWKTELKKVLEISQQRLVKGQLEPWDETKARCKPAHMKKRQSRNLRYLNGRHFTGDQRPQRPQVIKVGLPLLRRETLHTRKRADVWRPG